MMKFGGTSLGDAVRFLECAEIAGRAAREDRVIVVVSAMAGATDMIFCTIEAARNGDFAAAADFALPLCPRPNVDTLSGSR